MKIVRVRTITCDMPLQNPVVVGDIRFDSREYVIVQIFTDDGLVGSGFGMTRGSPVASIVDRSLSPHLVGQDPLQTEAIWESLYYRNLPMGQRGVFMRALSAVDIALWDLKAQAASMPLWRLIGGVRERVPVSIAGGYPASNRNLGDLEREMADYASRGFRTVKIAAGDIKADSDRLRAARRGLREGVDLAYDVHWAWRRLIDVIPIVRTWERFDLMFLEDPFPSEMANLSVRLRRETGVRLALGEDAVGRWSFHDILENHKPDVLRVDATVMGGISEMIKVCSLAATLGVPVIPHVFPEIHIHVGAAFSTVLAVEMTDPTYESESLHRLFRNWVQVSDGLMTAPAAPGIGFELDMEVVERYAARPVRHSPGASA